MLATGFPAAEYAVTSPLEMSLTITAAVFAASGCANPGERSGSRRHVRLGGKTLRAGAPTASRASAVRSAAWDCSAAVAGDAEGAPPAQPASGAASTTAANPYSTTVKERITGSLTAHARPAIGRAQRAVFTAIQTGRRRLPMLDSRSDSARCRARIHRLGNSTAGRIPVLHRPSIRARPSDRTRS